jgi:hypothetical protein
MFFTLLELQSSHRTHSHLSSVSVTLCNIEHFLIIALLDSISKIFHSLVHLTSFTLINVVLLVSELVEFFDVLKLLFSLSQKFEILIRDLSSVKTSFFKLELLKLGLVFNE